MYNKSNLSCSAQTSPIGILSMPKTSNDLAEIRYGRFDWHNHQPIWIKRLKDPQKSCLNQRQKIITALVQNDTNHEACKIAERILYCSSKTLNYKPCGHPLCPLCRHEVQQHRQLTAQQYFGQTPANQLAFLTILLPVQYDPTPLSIQRSIETTRKAIAYRFKSYTQKNARFYGAFEIDIKRPELITAKRTQSILEELSMDFSNAKPAFLPHLHAIVDLGSCSKNAIRAQFTKSFNTKYQVSLKSLHSNKSQTSSLNDLASYMSKFRTQYANGLYQGRKQVKPKDKYGKIFNKKDLLDFSILIDTLRIDKKFRGLHYSFNC